MLKNTQTLGKPGRQCQCLFQWPGTSHCHQRSGPLRLGATDPSKSDNLNDGDGGVCGLVGARVRAGACTHVCMRTSVRSSVRACVRDVFAIYDNNI